MFLAESAIFLHLESFGMLLPVFQSIVVSLSALCASKYDLITHFVNLQFAVRSLCCRFFATKNRLFKPLIKNNTMSISLSISNFPDLMQFLPFFGNIFPAVTAYIVLSVCSPNGEVVYDCKEGHFAADSRLTVRESRVKIRAVSLVKYELGVVYL